MPILQVAFYTICALLTFAGNSLLNRMALAGGHIDAASFTAIRMVSGAAALSLFMMARRERDFVPRLADWRGGLALFFYAACFSFAYIALQAGIGALLLFTSVQLTMQAISIFHGVRPNARQLTGLAFALAGLFWLLGPGVEPPPYGAAVLMIISGAAWGVYSSLGLTGGKPAPATTRNFIFAAPLSLALFLLVPLEMNGHGILLAILAGVVTSAFGYIVWYAVLPELSASVAGVAQLLVPSIAAFGGIIFLGEILSGRLIGATILIMAGIALTMIKGRQAA